MPNVEAHDTIDFNEYKEIPVSARSSSSFSNMSAQLPAAALKAEATSPCSNGVTNAPPDTFRWALTRYTRGE
jgi:hypothetical protein